MSAVASMVWSSAPIMNAVLTIIFLVLLRMWSRDENSKVKKITEKIGNRVDSASADFIDETSKTLEGFDVGELAECAESTKNQLDTQFFGELFMSGLASGIIIKICW